MMRGLKTIGIGVLALAAAGGGLGAAALYRIDLQTNPVAASIKAKALNWGDMIDLTPRPFGVGQQRADVVAALEDAGFSRTPNDQVWGRYEAQVLEGQELFQREANDLVCAIQLYVFVRFDGGGKLISARGTQHEHGCL